MSDEGNRHQRQAMRVVFEELERADIPTENPGGRRISQETVDEEILNLEHEVAE